MNWDNDRALVILLQSGLAARVYCSMILALITPESEMKISNSKKQLAKIISEDRGWCDGAEFAWFDNLTKKGWFGRSKPWYIAKEKTLRVVVADAMGFFPCGKFSNWHQTILSRDEYFHLYPAPDADGWIEWGGGECPVKQGTLVDIKDADGVEWLAVKAAPQDECSDASNVFWEWNCTECNRIVAYRLHKPEQAKLEFCESVMRSIPEPEAKPSIEQLAADYCNAKDYADRKQKEADAAKADAEDKLADLVAAGKVLGLVLGVAESEPELVITDWRDLRAGDEVKAVAPNGGAVTDGEIGFIVKIGDDGFFSNFPSQSQYWYGSEHFNMGDVVFIRRP